MHSKNTEARQQTKSTAKSDKRGELNANDLEKVVGGMKPHTGKSKGGDPCDGGE